MEAASLGACRVTAPIPKGTARGVRVSSDFVHARVPVRAVVNAGRVCAGRTRATARIDGLGSRHAAASHRKLHALCELVDETRRLRHYALRWRDAAAHAFVTHTPHENGAATSFASAIVVLSAPAVSSGTSSAPNAIMHFNATRTLSNDRFPRWPFIATSA